MTSEDIKNLFQKASDYAETKFGKKPTRIEIDEDAVITATWETYEGCGDYSYKHEYFTVENLN